MTAADPSIALDASGAPTGPGKEESGPPPPLSDWDWVGGFPPYLRLQDHIANLPRGVKTIPCPLSIEGDRITTLPAGRPPLQNQGPHLQRGKERGVGKHPTYFCE